MPRQPSPGLTRNVIDMLRKEKDVLIVPGDHFGMDRYLRIGYGPEPAYLREALDLVHELLEEWTDHSAVEE